MIKKLTQFPKKQFAKKGKPFRLKCNPGNFQCGGSCKRIAYKKRTGQTAYTKCGKNAKGGAKTGLEWLEYVKSRRQRLKGKFGDKFTVDATGKVIRRRNQPQQAESKSVEKVAGNGGALAVQTPGADMLYAKLQDGLQKANKLIKEKSSSSLESLRDRLQSQIAELEQQKPELKGGALAKRETQTTEDTPLAKEAKPAPIANQDASISKKDGAAQDNQSVEQKARKESVTMDDFVSGRLQFVPTTTDTMNRYRKKYRISGQIKTEDEKIVKTSATLTREEGTKLRYKVEFKINKSYNKADLSPRDSFVVGRKVFKDLKSLIEQLPDGTILECYPANGDGNADYRRRIYDKMGFATHDGGLRMAAVIVEGHPSKLPTDVYEKYDITDPVSLADLRH